MSSTNKENNPIILNLHRRVKDVVKNLTPHQKIDSPEKVHLKQEPDNKIILYKDKSLIRQIYDQILAEIIRNETLTEKIRKTIKHLKLNDLVGVDEFILKPSAKWSFGFDFGADFEVKWKLNDKHVDSLVLFLLSTLNPRNLDVIVNNSQKQQDISNIEDLIYPNMPIVIVGKIKSKNDVSKKELVIRGEMSHVTAYFEEDHELSEILNFLLSEEIYIIGTIKGINKKLTMKAGAVILDQMSISKCS